MPKFPNRQEYMPIPVANLNNRGLTKSYRRDLLLDRADVCWLECVAE